jgi:integrase
MQMVALCPDNMIGRRDRALLVLGFAGAFRRSELCALQVEDLVEVPDGLRVLIRRSKTDQTGGQEVAARSARDVGVMPTAIDLGAARVERG